MDVPKPKVLKSVISGGQTGVDRAALDAAMEAGIPIGGWCPKGRLAEDGRIPDVYPLKECKSPGYPVRTKANVSDSDGTLILVRGDKHGRGTQLTLRCVQEARKPFLLIDLSGTPNASDVIAWISENGIATLNVAGPRESGAEGIHTQAQSFLAQCFEALTDA